MTLSAQNIRVFGKCCRRSYSSSSLGLIISRETGGGRWKWKVDKHQHGGCFSLYGTLAWTEPYRTTDKQQTDIQCQTQLAGVYCIEIIIGSGFIGLTITLSPLVRWGQVAKCSFLYHSLELMVHCMSPINKSRGWPFIGHHRAF